MSSIPSFTVRGQQDRAAFELVAMELYKETYHGGSPPTPWIALPLTSRHYWRCRAVELLQESGVMA